MLRDALSEVVKIYPPLKLRVFVDDITALVKGRNQEVADMGKKVVTNLKEEVEKKGLKLSVAENGKGGKSTMIALCGFLENELRQFSREEGVTLADSVETLGLGAKEQARMKKCNVGFLIIKKNMKHFKNMIVGVKKLLRAGMMPARTCLLRRGLKKRWQLQQAKRVRPPCSFMEAYGLEVKYGQENRLTSKKKLG